MIDLPKYEKVSSCFVKSYSYEDDSLGREYVRFNSGELNYQRIPIKEGIALRDALHSAARSCKLICTIKITIKEKNMSAARIIKERRQQTVM